MAYFSTMDLASGYWQVPVREQGHYKTAFISLLGLYEFNRMPFGLTSQRLMEQCLWDYNFKTVLDDIIIFPIIFEDHIQHLDWVLVKNKKFERGSNLELRWEAIRHQVAKQPLSPSPVYNVVSEGPKAVKKCLH